MDPPQPLKNVGNQDQDQAPSNTHGEGRNPRPSLPPKAVYSIAAVSKLTGINCHTLRVWERRYGFPTPVRSPSGHRRYDHDQVRLLQRLIQLHRSKQQPIGELISTLKPGPTEPAEVPSLPPDPSDGQVVGELLEVLVSGNHEEADRIYRRLARELDPTSMIRRLIAPALVEAGEGWFRRTYSVYEERLITVYLRRKLGQLIEEAFEANTSPRLSVITGTVQGDRHEGGILMLNQSLEARGWRVHNLGVDLPISEYRAAVVRLRPSAVALSFVLSRNINKRFRELESLKGIPVFVGGRSIVNYQALARSHGLIPLPGPIWEAVDQLEKEYEAWARQRACCPRAPSETQPTPPRPDPGASSNCEVSRSAP